MEEVEITSEFCILMLKGLTGKRQTTIDKIYSEYDDNFTERDEVERRFRIVMDSIDDRFGSEIIFLPFKRKTLFYHLFAMLYDMQFNIGSPLITARPKPITIDATAKIKHAGEKIANKKAPDDVLKSVERRTTDLSSRTTVLDYLRKEIRLA
jgi:hypothetical protein